MAFKKTWTNKGSHWCSHKYDCISKNHQDYIKEYRIWNTMKNRCYNQSCDMYSTYGGRGIKICDRWLGEDGFINFYKDMGKRPVDKNGKPYQIDRIDSDGDYTPENCRWVPAIKNARNKRNNVTFLINGEKMCLKEVAALFGFDRSSLGNRMRKTGEDKYTALYHILEWKGYKLTNERNML